MALYLYTMSFILYALLAYILFQFIFRFLVPLFIATRTIRKGFREMRSRMEEEPQQEGFHPKQQTARPAAREKAGDYIDFEEVK